MEDDSPQNIAKLGRVNQLGARNPTARFVPDPGREGRGFSKKERVERS